MPVRSLDNGQFEVLIHRRPKKQARTIGRAYNKERLKGERKKDFTREHLHLLPPEERLKGLRLETVFEQFSPEAIKEYLAKLKS